RGPPSSGLPRFGCRGRQHFADFSRSPCPENPLCVESHSRELWREVCWIRGKQSLPGYFLRMHKSASVADHRNEEGLLTLEERVCSHGDTVHYAERPKLFARCEGSFLYDRADVPYLDLQMWYSAVNLGYANRRVNDALKHQIDVLPQLACQYLHAEKIELAAALADGARMAFGDQGRVHFNVGGSQAIEDALKLVR